jgi:hypothetical protein
VIEHRTGDLFTVTERPVLIAHVVNDVRAFGAGFARSMATAWPQARIHFRQWTFGERPGAPRYGLGHVFFDSLFDGITIAHMCAQAGLRSRSNPRPLSYPHLETCLRTVADVARGDTMDGVTIAMPRIGSDLAGGDWTRIEPLIATTLTDLPVAIYTLPA